MAKIYIVEDDDNIRDLVSYALESNGMLADAFETPSMFWETLRQEIPSLIILDIMLPEEDGISILKRLKDNVITSSLPVIMLTAKNTEYDRVKGLDSGADDYMTKPFSVLELISRVKAVLRRTGNKDVITEELSYKGLIINTKKHTVSIDGEPVVLTYKEFELLHLLLENKGIVMNRDVIMSRVWDTDFMGETRTVDMHIKTLRQKLKEYGEIIHTIRGVGYKVGE